MLRTPDKGVRTATGILSKLFRIMLCNYDIGPVVYERYLAAYIRRHKLPASERGNFNKAILRDHMSVKSFVKALDLMGILSIKITIQAKRIRDPHEVIHVLEIDNVPALLSRRRTKNDNYL